MDMLKNLRTAYRREFTLLANKLEDAEGTDEYLSIYDALEEASEKLFQVEEDVRKQWCASPNTEEYEADQDKYLTYKLRWHGIKRKASQYLAHKEESTSTLREPKRCLSVLPKLEVKQFDGDVKSWLSFWGQFKKIDEDEDIDDSDKFQYLIQSMALNNSPRRLLETYPQSAGNYRKALDALKQRFTREETLIETYIRGLLQLMQNKTEDITLLYDNLQTHLQALETLGVSQDRYAVMLFPMVESALPNDVLRAWYRSKPSSRDLSAIMEFLRIEVESEEKIILSRSRPTSDILSQPTACFVSRVERKCDAKNSTTCCLWCERDTHYSVECFGPLKMSLKARKEFAKNKRACSMCLRTNHLAKKCRSFPKCLICRKRHVTIMCPRLEEIECKPKQDKENKQKHATEVNSNVACYSTYSATTTLLPTVMVKVANKNKEVIVRALIDSGSQRSYITEKIAKSLDLTPTKHNVISQSLLGRVKTKAKKCNIHEIVISSIENKFKTRLSVVQQSHVCSHLPRLSSVNVLDQLRKKGVTVLDSILHDVPNDIDLLIGADYSGSILTGELMRLDDLTVLKTKLGWYVQNMLNRSHYVTKFDISDIWYLEALVIMSACQVGSSPLAGRVLRGKNNQLEHQGGLGYD